ncbi:MAG: butyrate kinase [Erysipelotrichaceae bacterium]
MKYLIINPGSTSTKLALFDEDQVELQHTLQHDSKELHTYSTIAEQLPMRKRVIEQWVKRNQLCFDAIVARGGLLQPLHSGVYEINQRMVDELKERPSGQHASNLGCMIAYEMAAHYQVNAYTVDPVVVDELMDKARISGINGIERKSVFHALNQKAIARLHAKRVGKAYEDLCLIVAHLGGGVSVGAHRFGEVVDVNNALDGEGPFSSERSGGIPLFSILDLVEKIGIEAVRQKIVGHGGFVSYFGTSSVQEVLRIVDEHEEMRPIVDAYCYQIAKEIAGLSVALEGHVDGVLVTGGVAYNARIVAAIEQSVRHIGKVYVYPGEDEMWALAVQTKDALQKRTIKRYGGEHEQV